MLKKILIGLSLLLLIGILGGGAYLWFNGGDRLWEINQATSPKTTPQDYALQDDSRVRIPPMERPPQPAEERLLG